MNLGNTCFFNSVMQVCMYVYIIFVSELFHLHYCIQCKVIRYNL